MLGGRTKGLRAAGWARVPPVLPTGSDEEEEEEAEEEGSRAAGGECETDEDLPWRCEAWRG
jgi:hypothetical protein